MAQRSAIHHRLCQVVTLIHSIVSTRTLLSVCTLHHRETASSGEGPLCSKILFKKYHTLSVFVADSRIRSAFLTVGSSFGGEGMSRTKKALCEAEVRLHENHRVPRLFTVNRQPAAAHLLRRAHAAILVHAAPLPVRGLRTDA